jgi:hypothetical protein
MLKVLQNRAKSSAWRIVRAIWFISPLPVFFAFVFLTKKLKTSVSYFRVITGYQNNTIPFLYLTMNNNCNGNGDSAETGRLAALLVVLSSVLEDPRHIHPSTSRAGVSLSPTEALRPQAPRTSTGAMTFGMKPVASPARSSGGFARDELLDIIQEVIDIIDADMMDDLTPDILVAPSS